MTVIDTGFCFVEYQTTLSYSVFVVSARCGRERTLSLSLCQGGALVARDYANPISVHASQSKHTPSYSTLFLSISLSLSLSLHSITIYA